MPDYQLSKVYQIVCLTTGQKYVGSTTQKTLAERLSGHISNFKCWKNDKGTFTTAYHVLEKNNYQIELLETFPCNSKDELNAREGHYIRIIDCVNKKIEGRTKKEWYEDNLEVNKQKAKLYNKQNKDLIKEQKKVYNDLHKDIIKKRNKAYRESKKSEISL